MPNTPNKSALNIINAIDETDAMIVMVIASDAFVSLPWDSMTEELKRGVVLLYAEVVNRIKEKLPRTPAMQHVFTGIDNAEKVAAAVRELATILPRL